MALGAFAKVLAQVVTIGGTVAGRAFYKAYKDAVASGSVIGRRIMSPTEAFKVLDISTEKPTAEKIQERSEKLIELLSSEKALHRSPYLQQKVSTAEKIALGSLNVVKTDNSEKKINN